MLDSVVCWIQSIQAAICYASQNIHLTRGLQVLGPLVAGNIPLRDRASAAQHSPFFAAVVLHCSCTSSRARTHCGSLQIKLLHAWEQVLRSSLLVVTWRAAMAASQCSVLLLRCVCACTCICRVGDVRPKEVKAATSGIGTSSISSTSGPSSWMSSASAVASTTSVDAASVGVISLYARTTQRAR